MPVVTVAVGVPTEEGLVYLPRAPLCVQCSGGAGWGGGDIRGVQKHLS